MVILQPSLNHSTPNLRSKAPTWLDRSITSPIWPPIPHFSFDAIRVPSILYKVILDFSKTASTPSSFKPVADDALISPNENREPHRCITNDPSQLISISVKGPFPPPARQNQRLFPAVNRLDFRWGIARFSRQFIDLWILSENLVYRFLYETKLTLLIVIRPARLSI